MSSSPSWRRKKRNVRRHPSPPPNAVFHELARGHRSHGPDPATDRRRRAVRCADRLSVLHGWSDKLRGVELSHRPASGGRRQVTDLLGGRRQRRSETLSGPPGQEVALLLAMPGCTYMI